jgi:hypothetical protein
VIPGSEQSYIPTGARNQLYSVGRRKAVSRASALGALGRPKLSLEIGVPTQAGEGTRLAKDPKLTVTVGRPKRLQKNKWMENQSVVQTVLQGLKAKGAVDPEGNPLRGVKRKKLTRRERALYNRMRLAGR